MFLSLRKLTVPKAIKCTENQHRQIPTCQIASPSTKKQSAINSLVHRAFIISDKEHLQTELNFKINLKLTLQKNGHDKKDIIRTINKHANKTMVSDTQPKRILSIFSYVKGITNLIGRILNKHNIRIILKPLKKIGQILRNPKD